MKLQILSNGTVSLNGTRITTRKMYGISTVLEEFNVDKKAIENIVNEEYGSGYCNWKTNEEIKNESYNQALEDFAEKMNRMLGATDLRDNGYYIENLVSIAKNELKIK